MDAARIAELETTQHNVDEMQDGDTKSHNPKDELTRLLNDYKYNLNSNRLCRLFYSVSKIAVIARSRCSCCAQKRKFHGRGEIRNVFFLALTAVTAVTAAESSN